MLGRQALLLGVLACLLIVAWATLSGGVRQYPRSGTLGQRVETGVQLACGLLSLLTVLTAFRLRRWGPGVRAGWAISLAASAGLSALVWGPPSPAVGLVFAAAMLLVAMAVLRLLRAGLA